MPRPLTDAYWRQKALEFIQNTRHSDRVIAKLLQDDTTGPRGAPSPSERTIRRIRKAFNEVPAPERVQYAWFSWPQSMIAGHLPWEASPSALELLKHYLDNGRQRPLVRVVRWYWRVSLSAPRAPFAERVGMARELAAAEIIGHLSPEDAASMERSLLTGSRYEPEAGLRLPNSHDEFVEVLLALMPVRPSTAEAIWGRARTANDAHQEPQP